MATAQGGKLKVWQWFLVYPTLVLSLGGSVPTLWQMYRSWKLDVMYSRVAIAEEQLTLWERNLGCLAAKPVYSVQVSEMVHVGVTLCTSGDALLRYQRGDLVSYTWVRYPVIGKRMSGVMVAMASEPTTPLTRSGILFGVRRCTHLLGRLVVQVVTYDGRICYREVVQPTTGRVVEMTQIPCTVRCQDV